MQRRHRLAPPRSGRAGVPAPGLGRALAPALLASAALSSAARANVIWPALVMEQRLLSPVLIGFGLLVEFAMLRWALGLPTRRALIASLAANAGSAALGFLARPAAGFAWAVVASGLRLPSFGTADWAGTFLVLLAVNVSVESAIYRWAFAIPLGRRSLGWIAAANAVSLLAAFASTARYPLDM